MVFGPQRKGSLALSKLPGPRSVLRGFGETRVFQYCVVSVGKKDLIVRNLNSLVKRVVSFVCVWGGEFTNG